MGLKKRLQRSITMTVLQLACTIIVTLMSTLLLITIWPRFLGDVLSLDWYVYLILVIIFSAPLLKKG